MFKKSEPTPTIPNDLQNNQANSQPIQPKIVDNLQTKEAAYDQNDATNFSSDVQEDSIEDQIMQDASKRIQKRAQILVDKLTQTQLNSFCQNKQRQQYIRSLILESFNFSELTTGFKHVFLFHNQYNSSTGEKTILLTKAYLLELRKKVSLIERLTGMDYPSLRKGNESISPDTKLLFKNLKVNPLGNTEISIYEWKKIEHLVTAVQFDYIIIQAIEQKLCKKYNDIIIDLEKWINLKLDRIYDLKDRLYQRGEDQMIKVLFWERDQTLELETVIAKFQDLVQKNNNILTKLNCLEELNCKIKIL